MRVALYGRVSTAEQSTAMQMEELRAYCQRREWVITEEYTDTGISGSKESRPALNRLLTDAKRRKFDAVLVYRYDRFARSLRQLVNTLCEFDSLGIHFVRSIPALLTAVWCSASSPASQNLSAS